MKLTNFTASTVERQVQIMPSVIVRSEHKIKSLYSWALTESQKTNTDRYAEAVLSTLAWLSGELEVAPNE